MRPIVGSIVFLVILVGFHSRSAIWEDLRVDYEDQRLTVAAKDVEAKMLLETVAARAGIRLTLIDYPSPAPLLTISFETMEVEQGIRRLLDTLRTQTPISYVLAYEEDGGMRDAVITFGKGAKLSSVAAAEPGAKRPAQGPGEPIPQPLPQEIEEKLPKPIKERFERGRRLMEAIRQPEGRAAALKDLVGHDQDRGLRERR